MKIAVAFTIVALIIGKTGFGQEGHQIRVTEPILYWYGLDFSMLKVYDYTLLDQGEYVKTKLCPAWQGYFKEKVSDKKLKKWLSKSVLYDQSSQFFNSSSYLDADNLVQIDGPFDPLTAEELKQHLLSYELKEQEGLGFVAIVRRLSREKKSASVIGVFFNINTSEPLYVFGETGKKRGENAFSVYGDAIIHAVKVGLSGYRDQQLMRP